LDIKEKIHYPQLEIIFDVGANIGQTQKWLRSYLPLSSVYCFEPVPASFQKLVSATSYDERTSCFQFAFGSKKESVIIKTFDEDLSVLNSLKADAMNASNYALDVEIIVNTIDHFCQKNHLNKIDLLKIDTEGFELEVLRGCEKMLSDGSISFVYCETGFQISNKRNTYFPDLTDYLAKKGYYFFGLYQMDFHD
jgi:FkbM family methyltransferase